MAFEINIRPFKTLIIPTVFASNFPAERLFILILMPLKHEDEDLHAFELSYNCQTWYIAAALIFIGETFTYKTGRSALGRSQISSGGLLPHVKLDPNKT